MAWHGYHYTGCNADSSACIAPSMPTDGRMEASGVSSRKCGAACGGQRNITCTPLHGAACTGTLQYMPRLSPAA